MPNFQHLADNVNDSTFKQVFQIIADRQPKHSSTGVCDSTLEIPCTPDDVADIQAALFARVQANMAVSGGFQTLDSVREDVAGGLSKMVTDAFYNPMNGIGTTADPAYYNSATIPVSMSPNEATGYYSSGGVPAAIIDKKSQGIMVNGYTFEGPAGWQKAWTEELKEYADSLGFDKVVIPAERDGLLYGGAVLIPNFKQDAPMTYEMDIQGLIRNKILAKNSISHFWHSDRWNTVLIPDYDISAADYLFPKSVFVPIAGKTVNTERAAILRPRQLPYWGTISQMGWGVSDMEGWIRAMLGYEMCLASIPIMAQQMSVMYRHIPLDGIIAQNGPAAANQFAKEMSRQMVEMSNISPKTFNLVGELKTIERHYQGFPELVMLLRQDIGAKSGIPESILFHSSPTGFSDNQADTTLKQAETVQNLSNALIPQLQPIISILVQSCFGPDSDQAKFSDQVRISFDSPVVLTNEERNAAGTTFGGVFTAMIGGGLQPGDAIEMAKAFVPDIELPQDVIDRLNQIADMGLDSEVGPGVEELGARLRGENAIPNLGDRLRGDSNGEDAHKTGIAGLAERIASPVKKLFSRIGGK